MKVDAKWLVYIFKGHYSATRLSSITAYSLQVKYGALSLLCLTVIASIVCAFVKVKYVIIHYWHRICAWVFRWIFCNKGKADKEMDNYFAATRIRNEKANYYHGDHDEDGGPTEHDLHISQDM